MILFLDPSVRHTGVICMDDSDYLTAHVVSTEKDKEEKMSQDFERRHREFMEKLDHIINTKARGRLEEIHAEDPAYFGSQDFRSAFCKGLLKGDIGRWARQSHAALFWYKPPDVKKALAQSTLATKGEMIGSALHLYPYLVDGRPQYEREAIADAIGVMVLSGRAPARTR